MSEPSLYRSTDGDYLSRWKRIVYLDQRFRDASYPNTRQLAEECGVSRKTIQRDIDGMRSELAAPIEYLSDRRGYHYSDAEFAIPAASLSERDLFALMVAENAIAHYEGTPLVEYLEHAFSKILAVLPGDAKARHEVAARAIRFGGLPAPNILPEVWSALVRAIHEQREIEVTYRKPGSDRSLEPRRLHPYLLVVRDRDWFLVARDPEKDAVLTYYVPRLRSVKVRAQPFERDESFSVDEYYRYGFNAMQSHGEVEEIVLRFSADAAHLAEERAWSPRQKVERKNDGGVVVRFRSSALFAIERTVLQYGGEVTVESPPALRERVHQRAARLLTAHG